MMYEICQVPNYKVNYANSKKVNKSIESVTAILIEDFQFHERLGKNDDLKLAIDVDNLRQHNPTETLENILNNICNFLKIELSDISYTTNKSKETGSHHIVIPSYYMKSSKQKKLWYKFRTKYNYGKEIDADIFDKEGWFRLPNQTKEGVEGTEHIIQKGELSDFVLKYIKNSEFYQNKTMLNDNECCEEMYIDGYDEDGTWCKNCDFSFKQYYFANKKEKERKREKEQKEQQKQKQKKEKPIQQQKDETDLVSTTQVQPDKYLELLFDVIGNDIKIIDWHIWFQIAGCLKSNNYDKTIFMDYSKPNDIQNKASSLWDGIKKTTMSIHTLQSIARRINFSGYKEWLHKHEVNLYTPLFTSGLIADYFKMLYGDKFIRVDEKVYMFNGVYWETLDKKNTELTNFIDKVFVKNLLEYANEQMTKFTSQLNGTDNDDVIKSTLIKITRLLQNINSMRKVGDRKPIIEDITSFITNNNIEFDANPYLFAFKNCVFDLKLNQFVDPDPTFYITKTAGYSYDHNYSQQKTETLDALINTIFPDQEVKDYYLSILATGLCGLQIENCFIATGTGGNGKSLINSLMMKTAGQYAYKLPSDVLLSAIKTGPNPEVANMHNARFILTQEPNNKKKICCSTLKEITGDKTLNVRELYSSKCSIKLTNTTLIEANEIPSVDEVNDAVFRRLRTIPFLSRYVEQSVYDSLEDKSNVFIADGFYKTDEFQDKYKQALFNLLVKRFETFVNNKHALPNQPKVCLEKCSAFLGTCDDIFSWFETYYEQTPTIETSEAIPLAEIYEMFSKSEFFNNLSKSDKRKYNKKYFLGKIEENIFLRKYIKLRNSYHNKVQIRSDYLVGWKHIQSSEKEPVNI